MKQEPHYWLIKSEPESYGINHLKCDKKTPWTDVRNFLARNYMRDFMHVGDTVLFYHSSCKVPGIYGIAKVASKPYADPTQFDTTSHYFDPKATQEKPTWYLVDIEFVKKLKEPITLTQIRDHGRLGTMQILQPGSRLSITPVTALEYSEISRLF